MTTKSMNSRIPFEIDTTLLIGVPSIDKEHYNLLWQLNALNRDTEGSPCTADFSENLSKLGKNLITHFDNEEKIFKSLNMPSDDVVSHVQAHLTVIEQYSQMNLDLVNGKEFSRSEMLSMIHHWVIDHVVNYDLKIRDFVLTQ